ncbi:MAG: methyltransferase [Ktedonobacterales bacterium]|nr:methyltransferase [Ktedonobacterales bacterium]
MLAPKRASQPAQPAVHQSASQTEHPLPPSAALLQMMTGYWVSQGIYVAAKLGLADLLTEGPCSINELAAATQTQAGPLYRVMRALASVGIFEEGDAEWFTLTPLAQLLQSNTADSMRALAMMYAEEQYRAWGDILFSLQTGTPAFEHSFGTRYFDYLATHPEASQVFNAAMVGWTTQIVDAVVAAYDFASVSTIVDVGGGHGALLAAILTTSPATQGILFDQPHVVTSAEPFLRAAGIHDQCQGVGGDFFADIPAGADVYVLAQILHDWDDKHSMAILRQVRQAVPSHGKLLIIELVLPEGNEPFLGKWLDLHMLVMLGGRERTAAQYATLLRASGFESVRVIPTAAGQSIVEALPI